MARRTCQTMTREPLNVGLFWNIGVRIEDDVLVTKTGRDVLTDPPKTVADIEQLMQAG